MRKNFICVLSDDISIHPAIFNSGYLHIKKNHLMRKSSRIRWLLYFVNIAHLTMAKSQMSELGSQMLFQALARY